MGPPFQFKLIQDGWDGARGYTGRLLHKTFSLSTKTPIRKSCWEYLQCESTEAKLLHHYLSLGPQHHYMRADTWALKHQRHFVAPNFAQNCLLPIFQPQPRQEFNFNPIFSFNPKLIRGNRFFPNRSPARNNERSKHPNLFVFWAKTASCSNCWHFHYLSRGQMRQRWQMVKLIGMKVSQRCLRHSQSC